MSSTVTIPTVRPYSSETTAIELRWRWSSASRSSSGLVSGKIGTSRIAGSTEASRPGVHVEAGEAVVVDDAAHPVRVVVLDHDQPGVARRDAALQRRPRPSPTAFDRDHGRDRRHHLAGLLLVQVEDAAEHHRLAGVERRRPSPTVG